MFTVVHRNFSNSVRSIRSCDFTNSHGRKNWFILYCWEICQHASTLLKGSKAAVTVRVGMIGLRLHGATENAFSTPRFGPAFSSPAFSASPRVSAVRECGRDRQEVAAGTGRRMTSILTACTPTTPVQVPRYRRHPAATTTTWFATTSTAWSSRPSSHSEPSATSSSFAGWPPTARRSDPAPRRRPRSGPREPPSPTPGPSRGGDDRRNGRHWSVSPLCPCPTWSSALQLTPSRTTPGYWYSFTGSTLI